jgi:hypothetical protein
VGTVHLKALYNDDLNDYIPDGNLLIGKALESLFLTSDKARFSFLADKDQAKFDIFELFSSGLTVYSNLKKVLLLRGTAFKKMKAEWKQTRSKTG